MSVDGIQNTNMGNINKLSFIETNLREGTKEVSTSTGFSGFFDAAIKALEDTSSYELEAQQLQLDYITGKTDDMLSVVLAEQKAYTALNFTVQITNKIIDSYKQIVALQL